MSDTTNPLSVIAESLSELNRNISHLTKDWDLLRKEVHREIRQRTLTVWLSLGASLVLIAVMAGLAFDIGRDNSREIDENNMRWCPLVSLLIPAEGDPAPTTERGRIIAERATELYREFHCGQ